MRLLNQWPALTAAALIVTACGEGPITPDAANPSFAILDSVHGGGNEHFFWLPPMVANPGSFNGAFDGGESAEVKICEWTRSACVLPLLAEFSMTTGPGSETVSVVPEDEHYIVSWHTNEFEVSPGPTYRISVLVAGTELGFADLKLGATGKARRHLKNMAPVHNGSVFHSGEDGWTSTSETSD